MKLEICVDSLQSIQNAIEGGASRVELCAALCEGGITPSIGLIKRARDICKDIDLNVMIRARGGAFIYDDYEIEEMLLDIKECVSIGVDGLVFGALDKDGLVCKRVNKILLDECGTIPCTYHRAFDVVANKDNALFDVIELGFKRILTSGFANTALEGADNIRSLVDIASDKIIIMVGSGVNDDTIKEIYEKTHAQEYHGSFAVNTHIDTNYKQNYISFSAKGFDDYIRKISDVNKIKKAIAFLDQVKR